MKKFLSMLTAWLVCAGLQAQDGYRFDHGPYLQGLTPTQVHVYFTTSAKGFSKVEVRAAGSDVVREYVTGKNGLAEANNTMNAIKIEGLSPDTEYEYRLVSKEMTGFQPYQVTFGDRIVSDWYRFKTLDPSAKTFSFVTVNDIHDDYKKYKKLLSWMPVEQAQMVFLIGDIISYFHNQDQPYTGFIDTSVEEFATEKPFAVVRGNHETRGHLARTYDNYIHRPEGHYYGLYTAGETVVIMLDGGEDKPDSHPVYAGITAFDKYREEQAEWLQVAVSSKEFLSAEHRIVMVHIPPLEPGEDYHERTKDKDVYHGARMIGKHFMPILNQAGIDLMMCGHTHRQYLVEKQEGRNHFPIVINDNKSASFVEVSPEGIRVTTKDIEGNTTLKRLF